MNYKIQLPFPPSVNHYWRHCIIGRHTSTYVSKAGQDYKKLVTITAINNDYQWGLTDNLRLVIDLYPPDRRSRDADNYTKSLFDALAGAGVMKNDKQIKQFTVFLHDYDSIKKGTVEVEIFIISKGGGDLIT